MIVDRKSNRKNIVIQISLIAGILISLINPLYSQDSTISLPDVKTVVTGDNNEQKAVSPDFTDKCEKPSSSGELLPEVPQAKKIEQKETENNFFNNLKFQDDVFELGYPWYIFTTINVSAEKQTEQNDLIESIPFTCKVNYLYQNYTKAEKYSDLFYQEYINTYLGLPLFVNNDKNWGINFIFNNQSLENGLQGFKDGASCVEQNIHSFDFGFYKLFDNNKLFEIKTFVSFYNRVANTQENVLSIFQKSSEKIISPSILYTIKFDDEDQSINNFKLKLDATYFAINETTALKSSLLSSMNFLFNESSLDIDFGLFVYKLPSRFIFNIAPFMVTYNYENKNNGFSIKAKTGVETYLPSLFELETKYKYAIVNSLLTETSNLVAECLIKFNLFKNCIFTTDVDFHKTFFDNGTWIADYNSPINQVGMYTIEQRDMTKLSAMCRADFVFDYLSIYGLYKINFMDLDSLESRHLIEAGISFYNKDYGWISTTSAKMSICGMDDVPVINTAFSKVINNNLEFSIKMEDCIKFFTNNFRRYNHDYVTDSGKIVLQLKLNY